MEPIRSEDDITRAIGRLLDIAPAFRSVAETAGPVPLRKLPTGYEGLAGIIVSQMVSRASADAIWSRLRPLLGEVTPEAVLAREPRALLAVGLSSAKERTLRLLAEACMDGLDLDRMAALPADHAIREMTALKGIGLWTAEVYLLFAAGHPDIFPSGDVALRAAAGHAFGHVERPTDKALRTMSLDWRPERSVAARLLWAFYAARHKRDAIPVV
ncbi:MAG: DNA-3-methyladenine glycosylase 2 family protein [Rhizobiaceae bacterium]|nr:DNA-3-methyladenine glycosylase 2 family protein [Rhizobiaceae bacterium]